MHRVEADNEYERKLLQNIESHGWQCTSVGAGDGEPGYSYTIGLYHSFGVPELMIVGLSPATSHAILGVAADAARNGRPLPLDEPTSLLIEGYTCVFAKVPVERYDDYVLSASWYYQGHEFPLYQVVWPSKDGVFPWEAGASEAFCSAQPVGGLHDRRA
jgi:hypothetical protein